MHSDSQYRERLALIRNPKTPRTRSVPLLRHLFLEDLLGVALAPALPGDVRRLAEDAVINRLPGLAVGERIALGRKGSGRIAGALVLDREIRVVESALDNVRLTEETIVAALSFETISVDAVERIAGHARWSIAYGVRLALLRQPLTSLARVLALAPEVKRNDLIDISGDPRMPADRRAYLTRMAARMTARMARLTLRKTKFAI